MKADKILLVGESPSPYYRHEPPLEPLVAGRIRELAGIDAKRYGRMFEAVNLLSKPQSGHLPSRTSRRAAKRIWKRVLAGQPLVMLGRQVERAFKPLIDQAFGRPIGLLDPLDVWHLLTSPRGAIHFVMLPHPSRRNRWYKDGENVLAASRLMTMIAAGEIFCVGNHRMPASAAPPKNMSSTSSQST